MYQDRTDEWFVPKFGSRNFRRTIGILFLPYTSIVICFAALGSLSGQFEIERLVAICIIYFLALGVSAHLLDAIGGKTKPWGDLPKKKLWLISMIVLGIAFSIGMYYAFLDSPLLFVIGIVEGFFLFAAIQTNSITIEAVMICGVSSIITYVLITTSRKYKHLKQNNGNYLEIKKCESILKIITICVLIGTHLIFVLKFFS